MRCISSIICEALSCERENTFFEPSKACISCGNTFRSRFRPKACRIVFRAAAANFIFSAGLFHDGVIIEDRIEDRWVSHWFSSESRIDQQICRDDQGSDEGTWDRRCRRRGETGTGVH